MVFQPVKFNYLLISLVLALAGEIIFRGFIQLRFTAWLGRTGGWLVTSLVHFLFCLPFVWLVNGGDLIRRLVPGGRSTGAVHPVGLDHAPLGQRAGQRAVPGCLLSGLPSCKFIGLMMRASWEARFLLGQEQSCDYPNFSSTPCVKHPRKARYASHQLLLRAGFIRQAAAGIFSYLPLARRSLTKIESIMREEMNAIGGQEMTMPVVQPAELWKETGRWYQIGSEMGRFKDKNGHDMVLAMTHEELVSDLVRGEIRSYRQLPALIYHIQTKWRDDPRPRAGLIRVREFTMLDSYSLDRDCAGLERQYQAHYEAYFRIFNRCGCPTRAVLAGYRHDGRQAGARVHVPDAGRRGYAAVLQPVRLLRQPPGGAFQAPGTPGRESRNRSRRSPHPDMTTIQELADFLKVDAAQTAKAVFMIAVSSDGVDTREQFDLCRGAR